MTPQQKLQKAAEDLDNKIKTLVSSLSVTQTLLFIEIANRLKAVDRAETLRLILEELRSEEAYKHDIDIRGGIGADIIVAEPDDWADWLEKRFQAKGSKND